MKNVSSASACLSAASNLPCRDSSGSVAWMLLLVLWNTGAGVRTWLCTGRSCSCRGSRLGLLGLGDPSDLISKTSHILKGVSKRPPHNSPCHTVSTKVASPPTGTATATEAAASK